MTRSDTLCSVDVAVLWTQWVNRRVMMLRERALSSHSVHQKTRYIQSVRAHKTESKSVIEWAHRVRQSEHIKQSVNRWSNELTVSEFVSLCFLFRVSRKRLILRVRFPMGLAPGLVLWTSWLLRASRAGMAVIGTDWAFTGKIGRWASPLGFDLLEHRVCSQIDSSIPLKEQQTKTRKWRY